MTPGATFSGRAVSQNGTYPAWKVRCRIVMTYEQAAGCLIAFDYRKRTELLWVRSVGYHSTG